MNNPWAVLGWGDRIFFSFVIVFIILVSALCVDTFAHRFATTPQDADVISISPEHSVKSKAYDLAVRQDVKAMEADKMEVAREYLMVPCTLNGKPNPDAGVFVSAPGKNECWRKGFENGFRFSRNFTHLIPKAKSTPSDIFDCWQFGR